MASKFKMFNKTTLVVLRSDLEAVLAEFAAKRGIELTIGNIQFEDNLFTTKLTGGIVNADGINKADKENWDLNCRFAGCTSDDFGKSFVFEGKIHTIVGWRSKSKKYPVICDCENGRTVCFTTDLISSLLKPVK